VSGVGVHDEVQFLCLLCFAVDHFEKPQPLLMGVELIGHRQHFAIKHIQCHSYRYGSPSPRSATYLNASLYTSSLNIVGHPVREDAHAASASEGQLQIRIGWRRQQAESIYVLTEHR